MTPDSQGPNTAAQPIADHEGTAGAVKAITFAVLVVLDDWAEKNGWQVVFLGRFIPVVAFNLINYAAGLARLTWWQFIWTTGIGILPLTVLMVVMGDNFNSLGWESWILMLIAGLFLWFVIHCKLKESL